MTEPTVSKHWRRVVSHPDGLSLTRLMPPCYNNTTCHACTYNTRQWKQDRVMWSTVVYHSICITNFIKIEKIFCGWTYEHRLRGVDWIGLSSVLRPRQHSIGYMGDGFYRSEDPTNSIKVLKDKKLQRKSQKTRKEKKSYKPQTTTNQFHVQFAYTFLA